MIGQAQTGTGKTAAFGLPIIEAIELGDCFVQAIVLAPTRELAVQAAEEINKLAKFKGLHAIAIYGGTSIDRQITVLQKGVHIVVGTPGRVLDHLRRGTLKLNRVKIVVLDEADEMLDMGFIEDISSILRTTPKKRQTLLFSATMPDAILSIARRYMIEPEKVVIEAETLTAPKIDQIFYEIKHNEKVEALSRLIDITDSGRFLVFCHTKRECDYVADTLKFRGYPVEAMHGDYNQAQREKVLKKFKDSNIDILIATDVAARGLDISDISHVVNYSIPQDPESYVHRVGRTGRAGKEGIAVTFVTPRETMQLRLIKNVSKATITRKKLPTKVELLAGKLGPIKDKIRLASETQGFDRYMALAEKLSTDFGLTKTLAFFIKEEIESNKTRKASVDEGKSAGKSGVEMARLFINIGKDQNLSHGDIVNAISTKTSLSEGDIEDVSIFDNFTYVNVPKDSAEKVIEMMHESMISESRVAVKHAKPKQEGIQKSSSSSGKSTGK
jgi:ATP-dependent RNA helicase DeaD